MQGWDLLKISQYLLILFNEFLTMKYKTIRIFDTFSLLSFTRKSIEIHIRSVWLRCPLEGSPLIRNTFLEGEVDDPILADWLHHLGKALVPDTQMEIKNCNTYWGVETQQLELQLAQHAQQDSEEDSIFWHWQWEISRSTALFFLTYCLQCKQVLLTCFCTEQQENLWGIPENLQYLT